jgi:hypothetical protein
MQGLAYFFVDFVLSGSYELQCEADDLHCNKVRLDQVVESLCGRKQEDEAEHYGAVDHDT